MTRSLVAALLFVCLLDTSSAGAQSRGTTPQSTRPSAARTSAAKTRAIRAELADVLIQSGQYDAAAREYRALLSAEPNNLTYHLSLARALAWGERFREAEEELRLLASRQRGNRTVDSLLLTVREAITPTAEEAARWFAERPESDEYRLILARALVRAGRLDEAVRHYDALLKEERTPELLLERAYLHIERRAHAAAESDLYASVGLRATPDALVLLADLRRWRGDLGTAYKLIGHARAIAPKSSQVAAAYGRLMRDQRPAAAFLPQASDGPGWQTTSTATSDNLGALLTTVSTRRGFTMRKGLEASVGMKVIRLSDRIVSSDGVVNDDVDEDIPPIAGNLAGAAGGVGGDVALAGEVEHRDVYTRARVRVGAIHHPDVDIVSDTELAIAAWFRAWGAGLELSTGSAYPSLVTMASFVPLPGSGVRTQLQERTTSVSIAGPVRSLDVALRSQLSQFNDGNSRRALSAFVRYPVLAQIALLYSGTSFGFASHSPRYWVPVRYTGHAGGAEFAIRRYRGVSFAVRALPGMAWATERARTDPDSTFHSVAPQLTSVGEVGYRGESWEIGTTLGYVRGRTGSYERFDGVVQVRFLP